VDSLCISASTLLFSGKVINTTKERMRYPKVYSWKKESSTEKAESSAE
jgi:hypothetical protein